MDTMTEDKGTTILARLDDMQREAYGAFTDHEDEWYTSEWLNDNRELRGDSSRFIATATPKAVMTMVMAIRGLKLMLKQQNPDLDIDTLLPQVINLIAAEEELEGVINLERQGK